MKLVDYLSEYTRDELVQLAKNSGIKGYSKLKKAELVELIFSSVCEPDNLYETLSYLTDEQVTLFRKASHKPFPTTRNNLADGMQLSLCNLGSYNEDDSFQVFDEIIEAYNMLDVTGLKELQHKRGWMIKCIFFLAVYYTVAPLEVVYELYRKRVKSSFTEMIEMLLEMDLYTTGCIVIPSKNFYDITSVDDEDDGYLYSETGYLLDMTEVGVDEFHELLAAQKSKPFYIPTAKQIDIIHTHLYDINSPEYIKLDRQLQSKGLDRDKSYAACVTINRMLQGVCRLQDIVDYLEGEEIGIELDESLIRTLALINNATRLRIHRGYSPSELRTVM